MADAPHAPEEQKDDTQRLRTQIRKLVLMKETGPKSAAWHRARVGTIWRLHRQLDQSEQRPMAEQPSRSSGDSEEFQKMQPE